MGPLVTRTHRAKVASYLDYGVAEGAELVVDGRQRTIEGDGYFLAGSLFDRVTPEMRIYREDIFGPVLVITRVPDLDAALELLENSRVRKRCVDLHGSN